MRPALYPFPNYALGVSRGVFSTSLKSHPEIYDEFSQIQCRPGAPDQSVTQLCTTTVSNIMPDAKELTIGVLAAIAQDEREAISRRTREASAGSGGRAGPGNGRRSFATAPVGRGP
jgi:hypothetical protein